MSSQEDFDYRKLRQALVSAAYVVILGFFFSVAMYFAHFFGGGLSDDQAVWGQFGDYVGGVMNPLVAFMALMALIVSIRIQAKEMNDANKSMRLQLDHFEAEAIKADLVRAIEAVSSEIDMRIEAYVSINGAGKQALKQFLAAHADRALDANNSAAIHIFENAGARDYHLALLHLRSRFVDFATILGAYESTGVHRMNAYTNQYRVKFKETLEKMFFVGLITEEEAYALSSEKDAPIGRGMPFRAPKFLEVVVSGEQRWWSDTND